MDEDTLNMEIRSFLKEFGVTAQRELEMAIHEAVQTEKLPDDEPIAVTARLEVAALDLDHEVAQELALG